MIVPSILVSLMFGVFGLENRCITPEEQGVHHLIIPGTWRHDEQSGRRTAQVHIFLHGKLEESSTRLKGFFFLGKVQFIHAVN